MLHLYGGCSMGRWSRPFGTLALLIIIMAFAILVLIVFPVGRSMGLFEDISGFIIGVTCATMVTYGLFYLGWSEIWDFSIKKFCEPSHRTIPRLEEALAARGVPFARREEGARSRFKARFDEVLDLDRGKASIVLLASGGATMVYLGPVEAENKAVIEGLKGLVDKALG